MAGLILAVVADNSRKIGLYIQRLDGGKPPTVFVPFETTGYAVAGYRSQG
jgi:hypothetical protein